MKKKLSWLSVGVSLATIHYGLGFLVGSGEAIYSQGSIGIIYAISSALGIFSLILIAPFYLRKKYPIWDLMGKSYGNSIRQLVASLSGIWMIGIVASQILGGSWALTLLGINQYLAMMIVTFLIFLLAVVDISRLSKIFFYMLLFSSFTLLAVLFDVGIDSIPISTLNFIQALPALTIHDFIGIIATTVLVTFIGMDFHQFIVQAKSKIDSTKGAILGGVILLTLSILLLSIITGAISSGLVGEVADAKQVVPSLLMNFGNKASPLFGILFLLPVIFVSVGSGSGVTRIVSKTITDLGLTRKVKIDTRLLTVAIAFIIALTGSSIISLIVSFYAIYVASVFVPFIIYLLDETKKLKVMNLAIRNSILGGLAGSVFVFLNRFMPNSILATNQATYIMVIGFASSIACYFLSSKFYKK